MDDTREITLQGLQQSLERIRREEAERLQAERTAQALEASGDDPRAVAGALVEGVLERGTFERGFLFVARSAPLEDREAWDPERAQLEPLASRVRAAGGGSPWSEVLNPEFAVNRSVVTRTAAAEGAVVVNDCLIQPAETRGEIHRAVLGVSLRLTRYTTAILYLDRALGGREIDEREAREAEALVRRLGPIFRAAYLARELAGLRSLLRDESGADAEPEEDGEGVEPDSSEADLPLKEGDSFHGIVGRDEKLLRIRRAVEKIKDTDLSVCIFGESGSGKEVLARAIHSASRRRDAPFVGENCAAIPENLLESELFGHVKGAFTGADEDRKGLFEIASGGTLFLDEIGDMSEGMQRKLLRVLEEGMIRPIGGKHTVRVDPRVICASNRDLRVLVQRGTFRADLFYRLNVVTLQLPPLRERAGDIPLLIRHFTARLQEEEGVVKRFSDSAMRAFLQYSWPGNVRELANVVRRAYLTCTSRTVARKDVAGFFRPESASPRAGLNVERDGSDLILRVPARDSFNAIIDECERILLLNSLDQCGWNKSKVTKALKIPRQSLYNKIAKYGLERDWDRDAAP